MNQGFHTMPADQYHADPCAAPSLSNSVAQILLRESPRKAWYSHPRLNPKYREEHDGKFDLGTCAHAVLLENDASKIVVVQADDWRTKAAKEQREAARAAGKTPLLERHYDGVREMVDAALAFIEDSEIAEEWHAAKSEVTGIWQDGGVWARCRFDKITDDRLVVIDYKTTDSAVEPEAFSRFLIRMGYQWQESFYRRTVRALTGKEPAFVFLAQETEPPYLCSLHGCHASLQAIADADVDRAFLMWRDCLTKNAWPGYSGRIHWATPTAYMMAEHETRLQEAA